MQSIFSEYSIVELEINNRNIPIKCPNTYKLNKTVLNQHEWHKEKILKEKCF